EDLVIAGDRIRRVAESPLWRAVGEHDDVAAREHVAREVRDDAAVGDLEARAVVVERARHLDRDAFLLRVRNADRLAEALRLVVAGARPGAGNVAAISLRRRDRVRGGVPVDLARRIEEEGFDGPAGGSFRDRVVEQVPEAVDIRVDALEGLRAVV